MFFWCMDLHGVQSTKHWDSKESVFKGRIQNMDPGPWTTPMDWVHGPPHLVDPVHGSPLINFQRHILPVNIIEDGLRTEYKIQIKYGVQYVIHLLLSM